MQFRVLGTLEATRNGESTPLGPPKQRALLALLLIHRNRVVSTDRIIDELWGDDVGPDRKNALHVHLSNLRKALEPSRARRGDSSLLVTQVPGYVLRTEPDAVDADRFESLLVEARGLAPADPAAASLVLGEALSLWRGLPYEEFVYESFAQAAIAELVELRLEAVELRVEADLATGLSRELVSELESLVRENPLRERLTEQLMLSLYRSGRQAEALRAYRALHQRLGEELGIEPTAGLRTLEERILMGDPGLLQPASPGPLRHAPLGPAIRGYELREPLAGGGSTSAFRGFQRAMGREVAVKVIGPELADDPSFVRRFEAEAQLLARLDHPHILPLYDYWREPGAGYVVTRLVERTLGQLIAGGELEASRLVSMLSQIGSALDAAHALGVVHGGISPESILIDSGGDAYLSDFPIGTDPPHPTALSGAASYAAPERHAGGPARPPADIFSLGVVAGEALSGRRGDPAELIARLDGRVQAVLARATAPDPDARHPSVRSFVDDLLAALELGGGAVATHPVENPYKGLQAFDQTDAEDFHGRERMVERLLSRLGTVGPSGRFVAVVGPSGSGKSSVVKAGLLPALRAGGVLGSASWFHVAMTPGRHPFEAMEEALLEVAVRRPVSLFDQLMSEGGVRKAIERVLPAHEGQVVLLIDQFEELFTLAESEPAGRFLDALVDAVTHPSSRIKLLITLRADFYDRPLGHRHFGELLRHGTEVITPMGHEELERAITAPAQRLGITFDAGVVAEMVSEVVDRPGALPLLQYALTELFERRQGPVITRSDYVAIAGVTGALGDRAESLYGGLDEPAREAVRQMFLRLLALGEGGEVTRRRVLLGELTSLQDVGRHVRRAIDPFSRHRLLSFDRDPVSRSPTVEISHEALLTEWPRLARWIDEGRSDVRAQRTLAESAREWRERERDPDFVLTGARLARYDRWLESPPVQLTAEERQFLEAGFEAEEALAAEEEARLRQRLLLRRRSRMLVALGALTVLVLTLGTMAMVERSRTEELSRELLVLERARRLVMASLMTAQEDPQLALMLAVESARETAAEGRVLGETLDAMHTSIQSDRLQYPAGAGTQVGVREGLGGPMGVFLLPPDDLIAFAQSVVDRDFRPGECRRFFEAGSCPDPREPLPTGLSVEDGYGLPTGDAPLAGTTVRVAGAFFEAESAAILESLQEVVEDTGVEVVFRSTGWEDGIHDASADIFLDVPVSALPEIRGELMDVGRYLDVEQIEAAVGSYLAGLTRVGEDDSWPSSSGPMYGPFIKLDNKSLIWHPYPEFDQRGYERPERWDDLIALSDRMVADGQQPWCLGVESGEASGWPATDWVETLVLRSQGPEFYDRWVSHRIPFDHPAVLDAARLLRQLAFTPGYAGEEPAAISVRNFAESAILLVREPPRCWLLPQPSFAVTYSPMFRGGETVEAFAFPTIDPRFEDAMVGAGNIAVATTDRPEVRAVMEAIASPGFGGPWARFGGFIAAHRDFDLDRYPNPVDRRIAELTHRAIAAGNFRFDASDMMPPEVGQGTFWDGMNRWFLEGPDSIEEIFAEIEASWPEE